MKRFIVAAAVCTTAVIHAQSQGGSPFRIEKLNPALDALVDVNAQLEQLGDRFALTEGPVWMPDSAGGYLLFSDNAANVVYRWEQGKPLFTLVEKGIFSCVVAGAGLAAYGLYSGLLSL